MRLGTRPADGCRDHPDGGDGDLVIQADTPRRSKSIQPASEHLNHAWLQATSGTVTVRLASPRSVVVSPVAAYATFTSLAVRSAPPDKPVL